MTASTELEISPPPTGGAQHARYIREYLQAQISMLEQIDDHQVASLIGLLREAHQAGRRIFVFGNGGSASSASHFATDLGKGASDALGRRFKVISLADNVAWLTALANDYAYEDVFVRQMENFAEPGDIALSISVSGNSPNCVKALRWAREHGLTTVAFVGAGRGKMAEVAEHVVEIQETHYGRVEDAHMTVLHLLCYTFMEMV